MRGPANVKHFWKWFACNSDRYKELLFRKLSKTDRNYWENELVAHLRAHCRLLYANMIKLDTSPTITLTITAHGNWRGFKKAETLVKYAPAIAGWIFQALDPPGHLALLEGDRLEEAAEEADIAEIWFQWYGEDKLGFSDISLYVPYILPGKLDAVRYFLRWFLYNLLGERMAGRLEICDILPRADAEDDDALLPIEELPLLLSRLASAVSIGAAGEIQGL
jgi:hypothetical protein